MWRESIGRAVNANASSQRAFRVSPAALIHHSQSWRRASRYVHPQGLGREPPDSNASRNGGRRPPRITDRPGQTRRATHDRATRKRGQGSEPAIAQAERREAEQIAGGDEGHQRRRPRQANQSPAVASNRRFTIANSVRADHHAFDEMRGADGALTAGALSQNCRTHR